VKRVASSRGDNSGSSRASSKTCSRTSSGMRFHTRLGRGDLSSKASDPAALQALIPPVKRPRQDPQRGQRSPHRQVRLLDQADDLQFLGSRVTPKDYRGMFAASVFALPTIFTVQRKRCLMPRLARRSSGDWPSMRSRSTRALSHCRESASAHRCVDTSFGCLNIRRSNYPGRKPRPTQSEA
jgi:hypothetical protein